VEIRHFMPKDICTVDARAFAELSKWLLRAVTSFCFLAVRSEGRVNFI
jgi:hypothetical protein